MPERRKTGKNEEDIGKCAAKKDPHEQAALLPGLRRQNAAVQKKRNLYQVHKY